MNEIETKIFLQTKLRNLKRKQARLSEHASLSDEYFATDNEIKSVEAQIHKLQ